MTINASSTEPAELFNTSQPVDRSQAIATQFVTWFFTRWNAQSGGSGPLVDDFKTSHFWDDCRLTVLTPQLSGEQTDHGSTLIHQRLIDIVRSERLQFSPNVDGGVRAHCDPHGLVAIFVCGTIHQCNLCVGLFESKFGLISDPEMENNFRIKFIELCLRKTSGGRAIEDSRMMCLT